jgi:hypothetical protein
MKGSKNFLFAGKPGVAKGSSGPMAGVKTSKGKNPHTSPSPPKGQQPIAVRLAKDNSKASRARPI